ncbi:hypothetical protein ACHAWF_018615 [Thalassiosira exigua]
MAESNKPSQASMAGGGTGASSGGDGASAGGSAGAAPGSLAATYPVNTLMELTLAPTGNTIRGLVYCTDEASNSVVLQKSLAHTTLSSEVAVINASSVTERRAVEAKEVGEEEGGAGSVEEAKVPLPNVSRRALEERERRALRMAEESFGQVNQRASPEGQKIFDKLLKACNDVVWRGESILVLKQIRVDPPYDADSCSLIGTAGGLDAHSLERVKKIVAAASSAQS